MSSIDTPKKPEVLDRAAVNRLFSFLKGQSAKRRVEIEKYIHGNPEKFSPPAPQLDKPE